MRRVQILVFLFIVTLVVPARSDNRDDWQQPQKIMDSIGVRPGMVIGEPGAGRGYFTFKLSARVGPSGHVYANDISESALNHIKALCRERKIENITTLVGVEDSPLLPARKMDMVIMVYVFHDLTMPVEFIRNIIPSMKLGATLVLVEREPEKSDSPFDKSHFFSRAKIERLVREAGYRVVRVETFLPRDTIYILRPERY